MRSVIFARAGVVASRGGGVLDDWNSAMTPPATPAMVARCQYTSEPMATISASTSPRRIILPKDRGGRSAAAPLPPRPHRAPCAAAPAVGSHRGRPAPRLACVERQRPEVFRLHLRLELAVLLERMAFGLRRRATTAPAATGVGRAVVIGRCGRRVSSGGIAPARTVKELFEPLVLQRPPVRGCERGCGGAAASSGEDTLRELTVRGELTQTGGRGGRGASSRRGGGSARLMMLGRADSRALRAASASTLRIASSSASARG
jgi:hypothetical protein